MLNGRRISSPIIGHFDQLRERTEGCSALLSERRRAGAELSAALDDVAGLVALEESLVRVADEIVRSETEVIALGPEWEELASVEAALVEAEVAHAEFYNDDVPAQILSEAAAVRSATTAALGELAATRERRARFSERLTTRTTEGVARSRDRRAHRIRRCGALRTGCRSDG